MQYLILFLSIINLLLGLIILIHSKHEKENVTFLGFAFFASLWTFNNFYLRIDPTVMTLRASYGLGLIVATFGLIWSYFFLRKTIPLFVKAVIIPLSVLSFLFVLLSDSVITSLNSVSSFGYNGQLGAFFPLYSSYFGLIVLLLIIVFLRQLWNEHDPIKRNQIKIVLTGAIFFALVASTVSFIIPNFFHTLAYSSLDNFSFSFFLVCIVIAILKHKLFNVKVIVTELFVFSLWSLILVRMLISQTTQDFIFNGGLLALTVIVGIFLIRSVIHEVEQREKIEVQEKELEVANEQQENFIHFLSHEVKGILGKNKAMFAFLLEGGEQAGKEQGGQAAISSDVKPLIQQSLNDTDQSVEMVVDILRSADLKTGKMKFDMKQFDLEAAMLEAVTSLKPDAEKKGLKLDAVVEPGMPYKILGDREALATHVVRNLIDNAVRYTPSGSITVRLAHGGQGTPQNKSAKNGKSVIFSVSDTGVGITPEDKAHLFTEGGHGKDSVKINVHSTGYGLYFAKGIVEAHHGRIWAESEGVTGKGSTFFVELPVA